MAENKTKPTGASIAEYIASRASDGQQADCKALNSMLGKITKKKPQMWGPSIVGYGSFQYHYDSGRTGVAPLVGFAIRGRELVLYLSPYWDGAKPLLEKLGKHRMGKSCLYFKRLEDLDRKVLERLVVGSIADLRRRYGVTGGA